MPAHPSAPTTSLLDEVTSGQAQPLLEAVALGEQAARVGFDWSDASGALEKLREEVQELGQLSEHFERREDQDPRVRERLLDELGDVLFAACMVARKLELAPTAALAKTNAKFRRRFAVIEQVLAEQGLTPQQASLAQLEAIWVEAKQRERLG